MIFKVNGEDVLVSYAGLVEWVKAQAPDTVVHRTKNIEMQCTTGGHFFYKPCLVEAYLLHLGVVEPLIFKSAEHFYPFGIGYREHIGGKIHRIRLEGEFCPLVWRVDNAVKDMDLDAPLTAAQVLPLL